MNRLTYIINNILDCQLRCYKSRYTADLRTKNRRIISVEEFKNAKLSDPASLLLQL